MNRFKRQIKMKIRMTKTSISRKNKCNMLLRISKTWVMWLTYRLVVVGTKTSSLDNRRIRSIKLLQLENLQCQEIIQTDRILLTRKNWRRMELVRQLWEVGSLLSVLAWHDHHALMITDIWRVVVVHQLKQQAQPLKLVHGPKSRRLQLKCAKMLWNMEIVVDHSI